MSEAEFSRVVNAVKSGRMVVAVDRAKARHFLMQLAGKRLRELTGESLATERLVLWGFHLAAYISMLASAIVSTFAFGWWAVVAVPAISLLYMMNIARSANPGTDGSFLTVLLVATAVAYVLDWFPTDRIGLCLLLLALALWATRSLYCLTPPFLRNYVLRNRRAFELVGKELEFREVDG